MEGQLFRLLYGWAIPLGKLRPRKKGEIYNDAVIVLVHLWAALHDRPIKWACQMDNWHGACPWLGLPSESTMSQRLRTYGAALVYAQLMDLVNQQMPGSLLFKRLDAHPLVVGGASKDPDARCGYGAGKLAKGYKLHELRSGTGHIDAWTFTAMADNDGAVAPRLLATLDGGGYVVADNQYDTNGNYEWAASRNYQLIAPSKPSAQGLGHREHSPWRLAAKERLENPLACCGQQCSFGQQLLANRAAIERDFAHEVCFVSGLNHLPFFIRRPHRVGPWIQAKLVIYQTKAIWRKKQDLCATRN